METIHLQTEKSPLWWKMPFCKTEILYILTSMITIPFGFVDPEQESDQNVSCDLNKKSLYEISCNIDQKAECENHYELELLLVSDVAMTAINHQQMECAGPTNILSFPAQSDQVCNENTYSFNESTHSDMSEKAFFHDPSNFLGSLVLDVDQLRREALIYGQDVQEHCLRLLAHGLAHLAGYDHSVEMDEVCVEMVQTVQKDFLQKNKNCLSTNLV